MKTDKKFASVTVESKPINVSFKCPFCNETTVIDYDEFLSSQTYHYWEDWDYIKCYECEKEVVIRGVEYD